MNLSRREYLALTGSAVLAGLSLPATALADEAEVDVIDSADLPANANDAGEYTFDVEEAAADDGHGYDAEAVALSDDATEYVELGGETRYETAKLVALKAFKSSKRAVVACGTGFADSLACAALAGALSCPILLTEPGTLSADCKDALDGLGVTETYVMGGSDAVSDSVLGALRARGSAQRLAGKTRYETQLEIFNHGLDKGYWKKGDYAIVASGENFPDALCVSPVSYNLKAPIFFVNGKGEMPSAQMKALKAFKPKVILVIGGEAVVSAATFKSLESLADTVGGDAVRLFGATRYETSVEVAKYAVNNLQFKWDGLAFASGQNFPDALAAAPLQGKAKSVLLLADEGAYDHVSSVPQGKGITKVTYLGGASAVSGTTRMRTSQKLGLAYTGSVKPFTNYHRYGFSYKHALDLHVERGDHARDEYDEFMDTSNYEWGNYSYLAFALLDRGYTGLTAEYLDDYIAESCVGWEEEAETDYYKTRGYGHPSILRGMGASFVKAAKQAGLNEAYLLAHARYESAWGCSPHSQGWKPDKDGVFVLGGVSYPFYKSKTYYNFFGIGAFDSDPDKGSHYLSVMQGWDTPEKALIGGAQWIADNYVNRRYKQNTAYLQRIDCAGIEAYDEAWHEYCTSLEEADAIAVGMWYIYKENGTDPFGGVLQFEVPVFSS